MDFSPGQIRGGKTMGIADFFVSWGGTKAAIMSLDKINPEVWGESLARTINKALDQEVGEKRSEVIQDRLEPWALRFWASFLKELRKV